MINDKVGEVTSELIKSSPASVVASLTFAGYSVADWVQLATLVYILLQVHVLAVKNVEWYGGLWKYIKEVISGKRFKK